MNNLEFRSWDEVAKVMFVVEKITLIALLLGTFASLVGMALIFNY